ncbi:class F sortase [Herbiconiux sp. CPCC 205763]|uniref:Class F sortase n=1 Tax=Herbiconiux aconitum TaxID=2970913 RepID=A0ABT2GP90_9MICO|nr:class F sortase [Herbiconiux aconitum]MCS5718040.1 class F sortase [Herbiconiux aconitum]
MNPRRTTAEATAASAVVLSRSRRLRLAGTRAAVVSIAALSSVLLMSGCAAGDPETPSISAASDAPAPTQTPAQPDPTPTVAPPTPTVAAVPLTNADISASPTVPTVAPVRVQAESLGIDVTVTAAALDENSALALSADPGVASWYRYGPSPWSPAGATVIAAHVDSLEYGLGSFARLTDAPPGTPVTVTAADGRVATFAVQSVAVADKSGIDWAQVFDRTGPVRLELITCGGEFDYDTGHYRSNVIVTAVPTG